MIDEFVKQAKRLFSSKQNGGKQVPKSTDRLHAKKQLLLAISMVLILGYSQFRPHFQCQSAEGIDERLMTSYCLLNGTTTVVTNNNNNNNHNQQAQTSNSNNTNHQVLPHVGLGIATNEHLHRTIGHNYMRNLVGLLFLLMLCSYVAQRRWARIFDNDVLQALLQLRGSEESRLVKAADNAKPYEMLALLSSDLNEELAERMDDPSVALLPKSERVAHRIDIVDNYVNIYDHQLDYYPNQLTYLLLTKNVAAYKLSCLKLRRKLIVYSLWSTCSAVMQFILPLIFIGNEYLTYGWQYLLALVEYIRKLVTSNKPILDNSIEYELSSSIFPIAVQCEYQQHGMGGELERIIVQCTASMNDICGKLFVVIWWLVILHILVELWSLLTLLICSINFTTIKWTFGLRYWPHTRKEADLIASFRYHRSRLVNNSHSRSLNRSKQRDRPHYNHKDNDRQLLAPNEQNFTIRQSERLADHERKRLEAEADGMQGSDSKRWYQWCLQDIFSSIFRSTLEFVCCCTSKRRQSLEREYERDINIYYLLYLIYLRLGKSKSRIEEVIRMTSGVLRNYLDDLEASQANKCMAEDEQTLSAFPQMEKSPKFSAAPGILDTRNTEPSSTTIDVKV